MVKYLNTKEYDDQKPGTSGLRKKVKVFEQESYTEQFIQAIFDSMPLPSDPGHVLVVGGDGRYYSSQCIQIILQLATANGISRVVVGQNGILSTPAASNLIRQLKADGGILLTASHNPGGPDADFGIKFNMPNGGPAPEAVTDKIFRISQSQKFYRLGEIHEVDISQVTRHFVGEMQIDIVDPVKSYMDLLRHIFDFPAVKAYLHQSPPPITVLFDGMHGVTGPYAKAIFVDELGLPESSIQNCVPKPDFGGGHPDPNLTYAHELVERVNRENIGFGAASDGDGDRNMIYGKDAFVTPSDSVAIIADWAHVIPYFKGKVKGVARSMPTSGALDLVAKAKNIPCYEVPTGWKFFGNLMDAGLISICGEESFGTGSDHIREKDGLWAIVAWLSILAAAKNQGITGGIKGVLLDHYKKYGRTFFSRYDYEEVDSESAAKVMSHLEETFSQPTFRDSVLKSKSGQEFVVKQAGNFNYQDPVDHSWSMNQGLYVVFTNGSRIVYRLSGTGSSGATIRGYYERYSKDENEYGLDAQEGLQPLIEVALELSRLKEFTGREKPTVIT